jgi:hypothetical protein
MNDRVEIRLRRLRPHEDADIPLPQYMTPGAAGINLAVALDAPLVLAPGDITLLHRKEGTSVAGIARKAIDAYNSDIPSDTNDPKLLDLVSTRVKEALADTKKINQKRNIGYLHTSRF